MSTKFVPTSVCDRCSASGTMVKMNLDLDDDFVHVVIKHPSGSKVEYDLCAECYDMLHDFLNQR